MEWSEDEELARRRPPYGPRNTFSNFAYLLIGVAVLLERFSESAAAMAFALLLLGIGSGLYHALKTRWANNLDWVGMYAVMGVLVLHGIVPNAPGFLLGAVSTIGAVIALFAFEPTHEHLHMIVLFLGATIPSFVSGNRLLVLVAVTMFAAAYGCWQLDQRRVLRLWGHAFWHMLTAAAMGTLFLAQATRL